MDPLIQPLLANGMAIAVALLYVWMASTILSAVLALTALVMILLRKRVTTARILGLLACGMNLLPIAIVLWVVFGDVVFGRGRRPPLSLYQVAVLLLTILPALVASAAFVISARRPAPPSPSSASAAPPPAPSSPPGA